MEKNDSLTLRFFDDLDLLTFSFRYLRDEIQNNPKLTFKDMLVGGFTYKNDKEKTSRETREFEKLLTQSVQAYYIKLFSVLFYRREFVTFFREMLPYLDLNGIKTDENIIKLLTDICKSDKTATKEEILTLLNVDFDRFIKTICNTITHELNNRIFFSIEDAKRPFILTNNSMDNLIDIVTKKIILANNQTKVEFKSYKLKKTFNFKIESTTLKNLIIFVKEFCLNNLDVKKVDLDDISMNGEIEFIIRPKLNYKLNNQSFKYNFDDKQIESIKEMQDEIIGYKPETYSFFPGFKDLMLAGFEDNVLMSAITNLASSAILADNSISPLRNLFQQASYFTLYQLSAVGLEGIIRINENISMNKILNQQIFATLQGGHISTTIDADFTKSIAATLPFIFNPKQIYKELLITETLNLLEFLDSEQSESQEHWKGLVDTYQIFEDIATKNGFTSKTDEEKIVNHIRNSIIHLRYIKGKNAIHIYDGETNKDLQFKFTLTMSELEEIKDCCFEYVEDLLRSKEKSVDV